MYKKKENINIILSLSIYKNAKCHVYIYSLNISKITLHSIYIINFFIKKHGICLILYLTVRGITIGGTLLL